MIRSPPASAAPCPPCSHGILYDEQALNEADSFARELDLDTLQKARPSLVKDGLAAKIGDRPMQQLAERVLEIASGGLSRRNLLNAQGKDDRVHLELLTSLVQSGKTPADVMIEGLDANSTPSVAELIARAHL